MFGHVAARYTKMHIRYNVPMYGSTVFGKSLVLEVSDKPANTVFIGLIIVKRNYYKHS